MRQGSITPWYRIIGPWPMRPVVVLFLAWYFYLATATGQLLGQGNADPVEWMRSAAVLAVPPAAVMAGVILLGRMWQARYGMGLAVYFLFIAAAASAALSVRFLVGSLPSDAFSAPVPILVGVMRNMFLLLFTLAISGVLTARLQRQVDVTEDAFNQVKVQQQLMLEADEAARRQVAVLLHDRVQAGLIAACLELQMLASSSPNLDREAVRPIIARLEELRTLDVRRAARALSPDLQDVDLQSALEDLAAQYEPGMGTNVRVAPIIDERRAEFGSDVVLGVYRIIEQALLNSASHGNAQHAYVTVDYSDEAIVITVRDDGRGVEETRRQGLGSAVLTTWTRHFDGEWSLTNNAQAGASLVVRLHPHGVE